MRGPWGSRQRLPGAAGARAARQAQLFHPLERASHAAWAVPVDAWGAAAVCSPLQQPAAASPTDALVLSGGDGLLWPRGEGLLVLGGGGLGSAALSWRWAALHNLSAT